VPIGAAGILAAGFFLPKIEALPPKPLDWRGFFLAAICFAGLLFGLSVISLPALPPIVGVVTTIVGLAAGVIYLRYARRTEYPLLDPRLFRDPLFRAAIAGGLLFRIAVGATPFLFPLMLQVGFGRTPFETGTIMFSGAIGAILAKFFAKSSYQRFGFKRLMIAASFVAALSLAFTGTFTAETSALVMMATLIFTGIIRSTFFTGINALVFAETQSEDAGQATSILAVSAQLSFALGVAVAGAMLEVTTTLRGGELTIADFHMAFFAVALVGLCAFIPFTRLRSDAGSDVSGHRSKKNEIAESEAAIGGE
jgi:Na+/melibiose symporter-like transporter